MNIDNDSIISVKNRISGMVVYSIPDLQNLTRRFYGKEEKQIPFRELRMLMNNPGGENLIRNFLYVKSPQALEALQLKVEPEYFYEDKEIEYLLTQASMDEFLDCLDFAPKGVLAVLEEMAVSLPLNDMEKREAILRQLNFNVTQAIEIDQTFREDTGETHETRRAAVPFNDQKDKVKEHTGRRVQK